MDRKSELIDAVLSKLQGGLTEEEQRQLRTALEKSLTVGQVEVTPFEVVEVENDQIEWPTCVIAHQDGSPMLVNVAGTGANPDGFAAFRSEVDALALKLGGGLGDEWRIVGTDRGPLRVLCERASKLGLEYMAIYDVDAKKVEGIAIRLTDAVRLLQRK